MRLAVSKYDVYLLMISSFSSALLCGASDWLLIIDACMPLARLKPPKLPLFSFPASASLSAFFLKVQLPVFQLKLYKGRNLWP